MVNDRHSGKVRKESLLFLSLIVVGVAALIIFRPEPSDKPEEKVPPKKLDLSQQPLGNFQRQVDLNSDTVLLEGFEYEKTEAIPWGGGNLDPTFGFEGNSSYRLVLKPLVGGRMFCRPGVFPSDFSQHRWFSFIVKTDGAPVPLRVFFLGRRPGQRFIYSGYTARREATPLEFDLDLLPQTLRKSIASIQIESAYLPSQEIEVHLDSFQLQKSKEFIADLPLIGKTEISEKSDNEICLGDFDQGLGFWKIHSVFKKASPAWFITGEKAFDGGPSLRAHVDEKMPLVLKSAELSLTPGSYTFSAYFKGKGQDLEWSVRLTEWIKGQWVPVGKVSQILIQSITEEWTEQKADVVVAEVALRSDGAAAQPRVRVELEITGKGVVDLDRLRLNSVVAQDPNSTLDLYRLTSVLRPPQQSPSSQRTWRFVDGQLISEDKAFPVFHEERYYSDHPHGSALTREVLKSQGEFAVDLSQVTDFAQFATAQSWVESLSGLSTVSSYLLGTYDARSMSMLSPAQLRQLRDILSAVDSRLLLFKFRGELSEPTPQVAKVWGHYLDTADAVILSQEGKRLLNWPSLSDFSQRLSQFVRSAGSTPVLAEIKLTASWQLNELQLGLALIHGASGVYIEGEPGGRAHLEAWSKTLKGFSEIQKEILGLQRVPLQLESNSSVQGVGFTGKEKSEKRVCILVNLSETPVKGLKVSLDSKEVEVELGAWEFRRFSLSP